MILCLGCHSIVVDDPDGWPGMCPRRYLHKWQGQIINLDEDDLKFVYEQLLSEILLKSLLPKKRRK